MDRLTERVTLEDVESGRADTLTIARTLSTLDQSTYEYLPDPRLLVVDLFRCVAQQEVPPLWVVQALAQWLPKGTEGQGRGKPTLNEAILNHFKDLERAVRVVVAKGSGIPHREVFQAVADEFCDEESPIGAEGSEATMRRAYYRMLPLIKQWREKIKEHDDEEGKV